MKPEDLLGIVTWGELSWDPLRPYLYFTENRQSKRANRAESRICRLDTDSLAVVPLTHGTDDSRPVSSPDGSQLAFLSKRSGTRQVWLLPLLGGEPWQLTAIEGGVKEFCWSRDSSGLAVIAHIERGLLTHEKTVKEPVPQDSDQVLAQYFNRDVLHITHQFYKLDGAGFFDQGRDQLVWVDLKGRPTLLTGGYHNYSQPVCAPDGSVYCVRNNYDPEGESHSAAAIERCAPVSGQASTLAVEGGLAISSLSISPDGRFLAFHGARLRDHGYGLRVLYRWDLEREALFNLSESLDRSVGDESGSDVPASSTARPVWTDRGVLTLLSDQGRVGVAAFTEEGTARLWPGDRVVADFALNGSTAALAVSDPVHPCGIVLASADDDGERSVWAPVPWSSDEGPREPEEFWASSPDGTPVHGWVLHPRQQAWSHPAVLEIHGGPMAMYGFRYMHEFQCLAQAGYVVIYTNPRGSQGYGRDFCEAIKGHWGDKDYADVLAGLDEALHAFPDIDRNRLGVAGGSYGGFMVNWIISHSDMFKAAVTMRSVVNRFSAMGSSDVGWERVPQYGEGPWWEDPEPYWQQSPLKYASQIHTPLLIEHQQQDQRLPVEQGEQLYSALKYLGRAVELVLYPHESHGMSRSGRPWHRVHRLHTIIGWCDRYLSDPG